jgi:N-acetylmuramic acid 6-phosphate etherase
VLGALRRAKSLGAKTILLTCNVAREKSVEVHLGIDLAVGPEILTGSTRLKAGTATKVALNIISTGAMVRLGKVRGNLMADLRPTNAKLRARAARIAEELAGVDGRRARTALEVSGWNVKKAVARLAKK